MCDSVARIVETTSLMSLHITVMASAVAIPIPPYRPVGSMLKLTDPDVVPTATWSRTYRSSRSWRLARGRSMLAGTGSYNQTRTSELRVRKYSALIPLLEPRSRTVRASAGKMPVGVRTAGEYG